MGKRLAKKLLLIGWDAADWKVINPLMDAGQMPTLEKLINGGVMGNIATLDPPLSPMLWTSIGTGKRPFKHGILGFTEPDPGGKGIRPVLTTSRKVKAIWNILTQQNLKTHVVGWWPSHPAEPINGVNISNFYHKANAPIPEPWKMSPGTIHPEDKSDIFAKLRIHPGELTQAHILPFVPNAAKVDQEKDRRLGMVAKMIAECSTVQAAATYILEHEEWDFMGVYFDAIDHFCHGFMKYHPPKMDHVPQELYDLYKDVVVNGYRYHDMMLERLIELAGPETTIMLISDHGFHPDHLRPKSIPKVPAGPALEHSPYGIICMNGENIKQDERIYGASILDVTPTILTMFGLPVGEDMDGNVLVTAFDQEVEIEKIPNWDDVSGECGMHSKEKQEDPYTNQEALNQLVELGYIEKPDENLEKALTGTINENDFYLARSYIDARLFDEAIPILERLFKEHPDATRYGSYLARCYQATLNIKGLREVIDKLKKEAKDDNPSLLILEGTLLLSENKPLEALKRFKKAEEISPGQPKIHMRIGHGYSALRRWVDAERMFEKELEWDPENAGAYHGLGLSHLRRGNYDKAADSFLNAVGLSYHFPFAHYHLGEALYYLTDYQRASEAFEVCLRMAPNVNKARQWLIKIYEEHLNEPEKAESYKSGIHEHSKGTITIVSGLPRSGTSMMMQMLDQGGVDIFTDKVRKPDQSNPKGYYEHEAVKSLARNKLWLPSAEGKAVKIISHLLFHLPANFHYKIIFMERDVNEVLVSQQKMLASQGKVKEDAVPLKLKPALEQNLAKVKSWYKDQQNIEMLFVEYASVIKDPLKESNRISKFLGNQLHVDQMASVVDKSLYRQKLVTSE